MDSVILAVALLIVLFFSWRTQKAYQRTIAFKDETIGHKDIIIENKNVQLREQDRQIRALGGRSGY